MAKEVVVKIKVDGQEVDVAKMSIKELNQQIGDLRRKLEEVPIGSKEWKQVQGDIDALEQGFIKAKQSGQGFVQNLSEMPGIMGTVGQSIKGLKGTFDLLASNPLIAVMGLLAGVVAKVIDKMKNLEGVMDPLEKIGNAVNGVFEVLANVVLPPVVFILEKVASGVSSVVNFFGKLVGAANEVGTNMDYVSDTMDRLNDTNAEFQLQQAKSNRALQEAREIAGDATKSIGERVQALKDAGKLEKQIAEENRARELAAARAKAIELATSLGYTQQQINAIKLYDAVRLESFAKEIQGLKGLNREKSNGLYQSIATIQDISAQEARINKKTQTQITGLEREEQQKRIQAAKDAAAQKKDFEDRLATFQNDIRLLGIKDEQEKARVSLEIEKDKTLKEIQNLEMSNARKKQLREAAEKDYAAKSLALTTKQNEDNIKLMDTFNQKVKDIQIQTIADETQRNIAAREEKYIRDVEAMEKDKQFLLKSETEKKDILKNLETVKNNEIQKIKDDAAKKDAELIYKRIEFERQSREQALNNKLKAIDLEITSERNKIEERRKVLDEQAQLDREKEIENLRKLLDAQEITTLEYKEREAVINETYNLRIKSNTLQTQEALHQARMADIAAINQLSSAIGTLIGFYDKESDTAKTLTKIQQGLALATTLVAIADAFAGLGKDLKKGFPANIIAALSTIALITTAYAQFKQLTGKGPKDLSSGSSGSISTEKAPTSPNLGQGYAQGGMIDGPRHAQGGTLIEAEGGEAIMSRGAVTMFGPLLSSLNQMGGGRSFAPNAMVSSYDNPKSAYPTDYQQTPVQVLKTYVVEGELTSAQQKQARLKDLSTI